MRGRVNSRGVTEVILALSLISISVAASVFIYHISAGYIARANASEGQRINDHLIMEAYNFLVNNTLTISVRNVGNLNVSMTGADFFLNGQPLTPDDGCKLTLTTTMSCTTALSVSTSSLQPSAGDNLSAENCFIRRWRLRVPGSVRQQRVELHNTLAY